VGVGVGLGVGVGVGWLPFRGASVGYFFATPPLMLAEPPFLTLRSLSRTRFFAFGFAMGGSP
jgi:hypothetical protein